MRVIADGGEKDPRSNGLAGNAVVTDRTGASKGSRQPDSGFTPDISEPYLLE